jgi:hypothetical protein
MLDVSDKCPDYDRCKESEIPKSEYLTREMYKNERVRNRYGKYVLGDVKIIIKEVLQTIIYAINVKYSIID